MAVSSVGFVMETCCPSLTPWAVSTETLQSETKLVLKSQEVLGHLLQMSNKNSNTCAINLRGKLNVHFRLSKTIKWTERSAKIKFLQSKCEMERT